MTRYDLFKFLHNVGAIAWIGGVHGPARAQPPVTGGSGPRPANWVLRRLERSPS